MASSKKKHQLSGYTNDDTGVKSLCEWESVQTGFELLGLEVTGDGAQLLLQPLGGAVEGSYGETNFDVYLKATKKGGVLVYLSLSVRYLDACNQPCAQGG